MIRGDSNIFQLASWEIENHNNFPISEEMWQFELQNINLSKTKGTLVHERE